MTSKVIDVLCHFNKATEELEKVPRKAYDDISSYIYIAELDSLMLYIEDL